LILTNLQNNQKYEFDLLGISTEPLAEDDIVINGKARDMVINESHLKFYIRYEINTNIFYKFNKLI